MPRSSVTHKGMGRSGGHSRGGFYIGVRRPNSSVRTAKKADPPPSRKEQWDVRQAKLERLQTKDENIFSTTLTYTNGLSKDLFNSNLGDKVSVGIYGGVILGTEGFLNSNVTIENGQLSSQDISIGPVSFGIDLQNIGVSQGMSINGNSISFGFSFNSGFSVEMSRNNGGTIYGGRGSFRPGGYTAVGAAAIYFYPGLISTTPFLLPQLR